MGRTAYPDKGVMGLATHKGELRLGLSATVASVVLYGAIVLFGVGSAYPSVPDAAGDPHGSAVLIQPQADTVSGSVQKLPQASPEPGRHRLHPRAPRPRTVGAPSGGSSAPSTPSAVAGPTAAPPRVTESEPKSATSSTTAPVAEPPPLVSLPAVTVPSVTVPVPELPVPLPEPSLSPALPLPLPLP
jgi:hypothetical protein